jgi:hemerythrin superfamily protein
MADVTDLIETDHREVEALFEQFKNDNSKQTAIRICDELDAHADAEEKVFYPVVRADVPDGDNLASEAADEHSEARQLIGRIKNTKDDSHLADLVSQLEQAISHHVHEEESEMLPKARKALGADRRDALGSEFEKAKANA